MKPTQHILFMIAIVRERLSEKKNLKVWHDEMEDEAVNSWCIRTAILEDQDDEFPELPAPDAATAPASATTAATAAASTGRIGRRDRDRDSDNNPTSSSAPEPEPKPKPKPKPNPHKSPSSSSPSASANCGSYALYALPIPRALVVPRPAAGEPTNRTTD